MLIHVNEGVCLTSINRFSTAFFSAIGVENFFAQKLCAYQKNVVLLHLEMDNTLLTASADMKKEYCAKIVRIGAMHPIEGADRLVQTFVDGNSVVVPKGLFQQGEAVVYCSNECQINRNFLATNNLFGFSERHLNTNHR